MNSQRKIGFLTGVDTMPSYDFDVIIAAGKMNHDRKILDFFDGSCIIDVGTAKKSAERDSFFSNKIVFC